jgi:hypothetical protein
MELSQGNSLEIFFPPAGYEGFFFPASLPTFVGGGVFEVEP